MKFLQTLMCVLALDSVIVYLYNNAFSGVSSASASGSSSVSLGWLVSAACFGVGAMLLRVLHAEKIRFLKSAIPLLIFFIYFTIKLFLDAINSVDIIGYTLGTSGGIFFGYFLGLISSISLQGVLELAPRRSATRRLVNISLFSFVCLFAMLLGSGYVDTTANLGLAHLLVDDNTGYQRNGNFLSMVFLLASMAIVGMVYVNRRHGKLRSKALTSLAIAVYLLTAPLMIYEGQLLGSNSVALFVVATFVPTFAFIIFGLRGNDEAVSLKKVVAIGASVICALLTMLWSALNLFNININELRIFNFGSGGTSESITTRLDIIRNDYFKQLNYAPIFGNMSVDTLTTGAGTYAHSLPLSLLTHLGLFGFCLFIIFFRMRAHELRRDSSWCGVALDGAGRQKNFHMFVFLILLAITLVASVSTFFVWMPLWFALGLLTPPLVFHDGA